MNRGLSSSRALGDPERLLREFVGGAPGRALRVELAQGHPRRSAEEVEDAVQDACERLVGSAAEFPSPGHVYNWVRVTAHRLLNERDERGAREIAVDPLEGVLEQVAASGPDPAEAVLARERGEEMEALVREVTDSLSERRREILALQLAGCRRAEIGERLGLSVRAVERQLLKIMDEARTVLARHDGGGCWEGEPLVLRFVYGLASSAEAAQARLHLKSCHRCEGGSTSAWPNGGRKRPRCSPRRRSKRRAREPSSGSARGSPTRSARPNGRFSTPAPRSSSRRAPPTAAPSIRRRSPGSARAR